MPGAASNKRDKVFAMRSRCLERGTFGFINASSLKRSCPSNERQNASGDRVKGEDNTYRQGRSLTDTLGERGGDCVYGRQKDKER